MELLLSDFIARLGDLWAVFLEHPKVYFPIIGEWFLVLLYLIISRTKEGVADVYASGVTLLFIGFELMPFHDIQLSDATVYLSIGLMVWGVLLIIAAAAKFVPDALARVLGSPSATMLPAMLVILAIETKVPIDIVTLLIFAVPVAIMGIIMFIAQWGAD